MLGGFASTANRPESMPWLMYASPSARCDASSPIDRPPASGRKSYCVAGSARRSYSVLSASRSHALRNISSSFIGMPHLLVKTLQESSSTSAVVSVLSRGLLRCPADAVQQVRPAACDTGPVFVRNQSHRAVLEADKG